MYSIDFNQNLIKGVMLIDIDTLNPHEKIIEKKKTSLAKFIKSYESYYIISSIVCCHQSLLIIDGQGNFKDMTIEFGLSENVLGAHTAALSLI